MIKRISLKQFRNHQELDLKFDQPFVYIFGDNGSGKTSILESIYFCATTKSHRTADEKELIKHGEPFAQVKVWTEEDKYELVLSKTGKRASINSIEKRKISDFIGHLRVVMFAPEDLDLVKGSPLTRRQFMDLEWMQINKTYLRHLNTYKHVLKQRNSLLKKISIEDDYTFLNILGDQLYDVGVEIIKERRIFMDELNHHLNEIYPRFSNHQVKLIYKPDVDEKGLRTYLNKNQKQDILYQATLAGPHRDDFYIDFNGFDAKTYASQGQQRLMVVALKLALLKLIEAHTSKQVVLLLDDVLSELDQERQKLFLEFLPKEHQIIMNSAHPIEGKHIHMIELTKE
jgi:DNA replication and repair protein RecF